MILAGKALLNENLNANREADVRAARSTATSVTVRISEMVTTIMDGAKKYAEKKSA